MPKNILIIGGVALGPKAAARAKRLMPNATITMVDEGSFISYGGCGIPYFVSGEVGKLDALRATSANVVRDPQFFHDLKGVEVLTHTRALTINRDKKTVTVENLSSGVRSDLSYDELVIATGATPRVPPIEGNTLKNVTTVTNLEAAKAVHELCAERKVNSAVIVGGGFIGLEMAVALADMWSIPTTVIEIFDQILPGQLSPVLAQMAKFDLEELGIKVLTGEKVTALKGNGDNNVAEVITDKRQIPADLVIFSVGVAPNSQIAEAAGLECHPKGGVVVDIAMRTSDPAIFAGGDCCVVPNLITGKQVYLPLGSMANRQGRVIGTNLAGGNAHFPGVVGTWCVKLNKTSAVGTGLTIAAAKREGFDAISVNMEQLDRAHFYPEKTMMTLEVVVDKPTRRLLGVQGVCADGIALKARIDAVAAMLQFSKPTLEDLSNLEVAYAPPFASAMDVINSAANVADNVLAGVHKSISPLEFVELFENREHNNYCFLDVRPGRAGLDLAHKYEGTWLAIPLEELQERLDEIPRNKPIALICNSGTRAYESQLILRKHGIETQNSLGGMQAMKKLGFTF